MDGGRGGEGWRERWGGADRKIEIIRALSDGKGLTRYIYIYIYVYINIHIYMSALIDNEHIFWETQPGDAILTRCIYTHMTRYIYI